MQGEDTFRWRLTDSLKLVNNEKKVIEGSDESDNGVLVGLVITLVILLFVVLGVFLFLWDKRNKRSRETKSLEIKHETKGATSP